MSCIRTGVSLRLYYNATVLPEAGRVQASLPTLCIKAGARLEPRLPHWVTSHAVAMTSERSHCGDHNFLYTAVFEKQQADHLLMNSSTVSPLLTPSKKQPQKPQPSTTIMDIPSSQQSTPTGHQQQHQLPVSTPTPIIQIYH
jgi:hypothetical protein